LPKGWNAAEVTAHMLTTDGRQPYSVQVIDGRIVVEVPERVPVMVYAGVYAVLDLDPDA
jgi:hypothetical protein